MEDKYPLNIVMQSLRAERTAQHLPGAGITARRVASSVPALARFLGIPEEELLAIESGELPLPDTFIERVCAFFGVDKIEFNARMAAAARIGDVGTYGEEFDCGVSIDAQYSPALKYLADFRNSWKKEHKENIDMHEICRKTSMHYQFFYHVLNGEKRDTMEYAQVIADTMIEHYGWTDKEKAEFLRAMRLSQRQRTIDLSGLPVEMRTFVNHFLSNYMNLDARDVQFVMQVIDNARQREVENP